MFDINETIQSKSYKESLFRQHCKNLKLGFSISLYDRKTKSVINANNFDQLIKNYKSTLDIQTKLRIKKEIGL